MRSESKVFFAVTYNDLLLCAYVSITHTHVSSTKTPGVETLDDSSNFRSSHIPSEFLAPQGLDQEYILHKPPAAQVLMEPSQLLTGHIRPTFILQRQTWELKFQDIRRNEVLVTRTKPTYNGARTRASKRASSANANHSATEATFEFVNARL